MPPFLYFTILSVPKNFSIFFHCSTHLLAMFSSYPVCTVSVVKNIWNSWLETHYGQILWTQLELKSTSEVRTFCTLDGDKKNLGLEKIKFRTIFKNLFFLLLSAILLFSYSCFLSPCHYYNLYLSFSSFIFSNCPPDQLIFKFSLIQYLFTYLLFI